MRRNANSDHEKSYLSATCLKSDSQTRVSTVVGNHQKNSQPQLIATVLRPPRRVLYYIKLPSTNYRSIAMCGTIYSISTIHCLHLEMIYSQVPMHHEIRFRLFGFFVYYIFQQIIYSFSLSVKTIFYPYLRCTYHALFSCSSWTLL